VIRAEAMRRAAGAAVVARDLEKVAAYLGHYVGSAGPVQIAWSGYKHPEAVRQYLLDHGYRLTNVDAYGATVHWS